MKKYLILAIVLSVLIMSWTSSDDWNEAEQSAYTPILMKKDAMRSSIDYFTNRQLKSPGKMYFANNYIYIVEKYGGIHIYNNSNPSVPVYKGFINVPGCVDVAVKGDIVYADNAVDLVAIETDYSSATVVKRFENVFPELLPPDLTYMPSIYLPQNRPENTAIVGWEKRDI